ncbi:MULTISPECIES: transposase [unclassified Corynebacterium]|uniref:transposase n=1 Tax=unclassified Corynebacterium TaxID=2624378 RepID=UPI0021038B6D|nr:MULTISPECIES: transposase [unclassified Corynebacterium]MDK8828542.1 transposase [Corynebacterium sp. MSK012]
MSLRCSPPNFATAPSVRGEFPTRAGNKQLKNAMFQSAWIASNCHPASRDYYLRKRTEGQKHNAAVMRLARSRCNVIYALLTRREFFREIPARTIATAA